MSYGAANVHAKSQVAIWQDPRDRVCVAVGAGQPVSLDRESARTLHEFILKAARMAVDACDNGNVTVATIWQEGPHRVGIDTRTRYENLRTGERGPRCPLVELVVHGEAVALHAGEAAAAAHRLGRYAVRPYVRKTSKHDGI